MLIGDVFILVNKTRDPDESRLTFELQPNSWLSYLKCSSINLSFFLKLCGENKSGKSTNLLLFNTKSINPIKKYPHIINSFACV